MPGEQELEALLHEAAVTMGHDAPAGALAAARRELRLLQQRQPLLVYALGREALVRMAWERGLAVLAQQEQHAVLRKKMQVRGEQEFTAGLARRGGDEAAVEQLLAYAAAVQDLSVERAAVVLANATLARLLPLLMALRDGAAVQDFVTGLLAVPGDAGGAAGASQGGAAGLADDAVATAAATAVTATAASGAAVRTLVRDWHAATAALRQRLLAAGGTVVEAEAWWLPQDHDQARVAAAGAAAWVAEVLPLIARGAYADADGALLDEAALRAWLLRVQAAIALGGRDRDALMLQLRWRDAQAWLAYQRRYGSADVVAALCGHVRSLARRVALVEALGPEPRADFMHWQEQVPAAPGDESGPAQPNFSTGLFTEVAGEHGLLPGPGLVDFLPGLRHYLREVRAVPAVLGGLACAALQRASAWLWRAPLLARLEPVLYALDAARPRDVVLLQAAQLAVEVFAAELNRFAGGFVALPAATATPLLQATGPQALAAAARRAQATLLLIVLGELAAACEWAELAAADRALLAAQGVDADTWALWRQGGREHWRGGVAGAAVAGMSVAGMSVAGMGVTSTSAAALSPAALARAGGADVAMQAAAERLAALALGALPMFSPVPAVDAGAVPAPDAPLTLTAAVRLLAQLDLPQLLPWAQVAALPGGGSKAAYMAALVAGSMMAGAVSLGIGQRLAGQAIEQETSLPALWGAVMVQGGAIGIYIDALLDLPGARDGDEAPAAAAGDTAEALRLVHNLRRGSTLWYGKAALDHFLLHLLHQMLAPEYLGQMQEQAGEQFGQPFAWMPGAQRSGLQKPVRQKTALQKQGTAP